MPIPGQRLTWPIRASQLRWCCLSFTPLGSRKAQGRDAALRRPHIAPRCPYLSLRFAQRSGYSERVKPSPMEKAAREVAGRLRDRGHIAYFAGGCVRDMVRGLAPKDYD